MQYIHIKNWEKTQHYKNRKPPWIRLYVDIIDKYDQDGKVKKFHSMPDNSKLTFIMLLCLSSRFNNNIPYESDSELKLMLGIENIELKKLISCGYIYINNNDSIIDSKDDSNIDRDVLATDTDTDTDNNTASGDAENNNFLITKKKRKLNGKRYQTFMLFWEAFDYKRGRAEAGDAWLDIPQLTDSLVNKIVKAAKLESSNRQRLIKNGTTPKMAQGWISGRRWEDEIVKTEQNTTPNIFTGEYND